MKYTKEVVRRNIEVGKVLNEVWVYSPNTKYNTYINWGTVPPHLIKELIELEIMDLERNRFLSTPINKVERNLLVHMGNSQKRMSI